ncbi:NF038130 family PEP-CTERM protein [Capilliphycus salinus ALCB114379]|uniref:NF038130 family PEP-CTERM protein n=1 Tax=Capilliphycus salinus TaxID=2768948 RepID=UPI0039A42CAA
MAGLLNKFVVGASVVVGMSAVVAPAQAAVLGMNGSDYKTYTHDINNLWVGGEGAAIDALTDGDLTTNVELNYTGESDDKNVGFTAVAGDYTVNVSSVTDAEFLTFQDKWVADLMDAYAPLKAVWGGLSSNVQTIAKNMFTGVVGSGDVNVAEFSLDETGAISMQTMGFFDLKPRVNMMIGAALSNQMTAMLFGAELNALSGALGQIDALQISEIAKVTINGQSEYVYGFNATNSGFVALDDVAGKSYSGVYAWSKAGQPPVAAVPEPSTMLGLMAVGGLFAAAKRKANKA